MNKETSDLHKVDLVMWTKNGEAFLPKVLAQIDRVIPKENVCHKILVDDHSVDRTVEIAKSFNWTIYSNPEGGVSSGANEALRHVDRDFFVSVEQDIILSKSWWRKISKHIMEKPSVGCAEGVRILANPILRLLEEWQYETLGRHSPQVSIDNNIFRTEVVRSMGGFPTDCPICTDIALMRRMSMYTPYKWIVDPSVISVHLRDKLQASLEHTYKMGYLCARTPYCIHEENPRLAVVLRIFLTSPIRALQIAIKRNCPNMVWGYPLLRLYQIKTHLIWGRA